ncbi:hypothetical protein BO86DRAFT_350848, partial [Aspergillus japonicus CBS 114.51]
MAPTTDIDSSEDVNDFLLRIRELGEKRDKEDEERTKKLEEEILQGRKERQARRADSPVLDAARLSISSTLSHRAIEPPEQFGPSLYTLSRDSDSRPESIGDDTSTTTDGGRRGSTLTGVDGELPSKPFSPLRSRTGTLSWQQRPTSRDSNRQFFSSSPSRWRALSTASTDEQNANRNSFAASPTFKDISWARQTEGSVSPTRSKHMEDERPRTPVSEASFQPQEAEKESTPEPKKEIDHLESVEGRSRSPSRASSTFAESTLGHRYSSVSSVSTATGLGSPLPLTSAQKLEPRKPEEVLEDQMSVPPSPRRLSPERSTSPTKGLGGFVQSAMMKR